jgi:hypothetical protein
LSQDFIGSLLADRKGNACSHYRIEPCHREKTNGEPRETFGAEAVA